jgi:hypothetical protein
MNKPLFTLICEESARYSKILLSSKCLVFLFFFAICASCITALCSQWYTTTLCIKSPMTTTHQLLSRRLTAPQELPEDCESPEGTLSTRNNGNLWSELTSLASLTDRLIVGAKRSLPIHSYLSLNFGSKRPTFPTS